MWETGNKFGSHRSLFAVGVFAWLASCCVGLATLTRYGATPGLGLQPPQVWPSTSRLEPPDGTPTLLFFIHPHCPCSRASLGELERSLPFAPKPYRIKVLVYTPAGAPRDWTATTLCERALKLPRTMLVADVEGREAALFGVTTSGHAIFFDGRGERLFEGGLTGSRGHEGDNDGRESLRALLAGTPAAIHATPVFGCALGTPSGAKCALHAESELAD